MTNTPWLSLTIWSTILFGLRGCSRSATATRHKCGRFSLIRRSAGPGGESSLYTGFKHGRGPRCSSRTLGPGSRGSTSSTTCGVDGIFACCSSCCNSFSPCSCACRLGVNHEESGRSTCAFLIMSGLLNGVFAALDAMLFYGLLRRRRCIPMYLVIGVWAGPNASIGGEVLPLTPCSDRCHCWSPFLYLYDKSGGSFSISTAQLPLAMTPADSAVHRFSPTRCG